MLSPRTSLATVLAVSLAVLSAAASAAERQKVVYHINEYGAKRQAAAMVMIQNHLNAVGRDKVEIAVVLHGPGLSLLLYPDAAADNRLEEGNAGNTLTARLEGLKEQGVRFLVCRNTVLGLGIDLEDLYDVFEEDIVRSGVAHLATLQGQGYAYIKP